MKSSLSSAVFPVESLKAPALHEISAMEQLPLSDTSVVLQLGWNEGSSAGVEAYSSSCPRVFLSCKVDEVWGEGHLLDDCHNVSQLKGLRADGMHYHMHLPSCFSSKEQRLLRLKNKEHLIRTQKQREAF
jgi:hypothetical protein